MSEASAGGAASAVTAIGVDVGAGAWAVVKIAVAGGRLAEPVGCRSAFGAPIEGDDSWTIIDAPMGLVAQEDATPTNRGFSGDRDVDKAARKWCPSTSSVFVPPTREQLASAAAEHQRVSALGGGEKRRLSNVNPGGMSQQSFELVPAIEAARLVKASAPDRVFEAHPEVVFTALAGAVLPLPKSTLAGALARANVLRRRLRFDVLTWAIERECHLGVPADNWLDALAMAVVAADWASGDRRVLRTRDGAVLPWNGEQDGIMALPRVELAGPPPRLVREDAIRRFCARLPPEGAGG